MCPLYKTEYHRYFYTLFGEQYRWHSEQNFLAMNSNFQTIQATELKLAHQQKQLAKNFRSMEIKERKIARKELYLELRSFKANSLENFMYNLNMILKSIQLDPNFEIVFKLLRKHQYCLSNLCYSLPIFTVIGLGVIQIQVQTSHQTLAKALYISCTVL